MTRYCSPNTSTQDSLGPHAGTGGTPESAIIYDREGREGSSFDKEGLAGHTSCQVRSSPLNSGDGKQGSLQPREVVRFAGFFCTRCELRSVMQDGPDLQQNELSTRRKKPPIGRVLGRVEKQTNQEGGHA